MSPVYEALIKRLKQLPGLGARSAERVALHLLVEKPDRLPGLLEDLRAASEKLHRCPRTGNLTEDELDPIYADPARDRQTVCVVEQVPDVFALERSAAFRGTYHVLHGKLSPIHGVGAEALFIEPLRQRIEEDNVTELILALANDVEGEATCHYLREELVGERAIKVSRIGFGLPSGGGILYADSVTLRSALEGRRQL
ncbi:MAG: recombination mediator RecR [Verrucomicrobiota bacterium]